MMPMVELCLLHDALKNFAVRYPSFSLEFSGLLFKPFDIRIQDKSGHFEGWQGNVEEVCCEFFCALLDSVANRFASTSSLVEVISYLQ